MTRPRSGLIRAILAAVILGAGVYGMTVAALAISY